MPGRHQCKIFAPPIGTATPNRVYTQQAARPACQEDTNANFSHLLLAQLTQQGAKPACQEDITAICSHLLLAGDVYTQQSHLHTASCQTLSRGSEYCACHTDSSRGPRRPSAPQPFLTDPFWRLQVLRLPRRQEPRPTATRPATLPRRPGAPQPFLDKYCACGTDRSRGPRRPGAPQPFLEAPIPSTAPAGRTGAAAHGDQARRNPFWKLQVLRLPRRQEPRPTATRRAATLSGGSKYRACHADRSRGPRRPGAPQPFLEAPSTAILQGMCE